MDQGICSSCYAFVAASALQASQVLYHRNLSQNGDEFSDLYYLMDSFNSDPFSNVI
jgi:C1A family cysteine protease